MVPRWLVVHLAVLAGLSACGGASRPSTAVAPTTPATIAQATVFSPIPTTATTAASTTSAGTAITPTVLGTSVTPPPVIAAAPQTTVPAPDPCGMYDFRNFQYYFPEYETLRVTDGRAVRGSPGVLGYITLDVRDVETADIGGVDEAAETIISTVADTGTDGRYSNVYIFTCDERQAVSLITQAGVGDRAWNGVKSIAVRDGVLVIDRYADDQGACCPGAVARTSFRLTGTELIATGPKSLRKYLPLNTAAPLALSFLPNTSTVSVAGDTDNAKRAGLNLFAGQKLKVAVDPAFDGEPEAIVDVVANGTRIIASAASGKSVVAIAPSDGYYEIAARPSKPDAPAPFAAEITVGRVGDPTLTA